VISFNSTGTYVGQAAGAAVGGVLLVSGLGATPTVLIAVAGLVADQYFRFVEQNSK